MQPAYNNYQQNYAPMSYSNIEDKTSFDKFKIANVGLFAFALSKSYEAVISKVSNAIGFNLGFQNTTAFFICALGLYYINENYDNCLETNTNYKIMSIAASYFFGKTMVEYAIIGVSGVFSSLYENIVGSDNKNKKKAPTKKAKK